MPTHVVYTYIQMYGDFSIKLLKLSQNKHGSIFIAMISLHHAHCNLKNIQIKLTILHYDHRVS